MPVNPNLPPNAWEDWRQPTPATADQVEQLILWLKPIPRCLITLRQMLESQQQRIDAMSAHLITVVQEVDSNPKKSTPQQNQKSIQSGNWNRIPIRAIEIGVMVLLTALVTQFSPFGLNSLNQRIDHLLNQPAPTGRNP